MATRISNHLINEASSLAEEARSLIPQSCGLLVKGIDSKSIEFPRQDWGSSTHPSKSRRMEFGAGRQVAKQLLHEKGASTISLPRMANGAPQ